MVRWLCTTIIKGDKMKIKDKLILGLVDFHNWDTDNIMMKQVETLQKLRRLARKHQKLSIDDCNGYGNINGICYYNGTIDDYAMRKHGKDVQSAYINNPKDDETTIFDIEIEKIKHKIVELCKNIGFDVEFQGDPRGATVKISLKGRNLTELLWS